MKNYMKILYAVLLIFSYNTDNCSAEQVSSTTNQGKNNQQDQNINAYNNFVSGLAKSPLIGNDMQQAQNSTNTPELPLGQTPVLNDIPQQIQNNTEQLPTIGNIITDTKQLSTIGTMITGDDTQQQTNTLSTTGIQEGNVEQHQNIEQIMADTSTLPSLTNDFSAGTTPVLPSLHTEQLSTLAQSLTGDTTTETNPVPEQMQTVNNMITGTEVMPNIGNMITEPTTTGVPSKTQVNSNLDQSSTIGQIPVTTNNTQPRNVSNTTGIIPEIPANNTPLQTLGNIITDPNTTNVAGTTTQSGNVPLPTVGTMI